MASTYKANAKKKAGESAPKGKPGRKPKVEGAVAPPKPAGEGDLLDAIEAMKPLIASLGADKVHRLVDLLG